MISCSMFQRNPFSKDESNSAIKQDNSRIQIGVDSWKGLIAGKVGKIERDYTRSPMTEAEAKVSLTR